MRIEPIDPQADETGLRACREIFEAARPLDDPDSPVMSYQAFRGWWAFGYGGEPRQVWLATAASEPVGCYLLELPDRDNTSSCFFLPVVTPSARRGGIGTELLAHGSEQARREGRTQLSADMREGSAGEAFARAMGATGGLTDVRRELAIDDDLRARLDKLRAEVEPGAAGYELLRWQGPTPDEHLDQVAAISAAMEDAPHEPGHEPERWDQDRVRAVDRGWLNRGLAMYTVAARHRGTGELGGFTQVVVDPGVPGWSFQVLTAVTRPHRGHRLGMLVKVEMHQWLAAAEPDVRRAQTWNASGNDHMTAINDRLGYVEAARFRNWKLATAEGISRKSPGGAAA
jgi:GNAT superfamily N-acetyltransferase